MSLNYYFNYAEIDPATNMCIGFTSASHEWETIPENYVQVPVNDPEYMGKFYLDGNWYEDPEGLIPWTSSLL